MDKLKIVLKGEHALLMHNAAGMEIAGEAPTRKKIPLPEEEAETGLYKLPSGELYVPAIAVRSSIIGGGKGYRIGKLGASGILSACITIEDENFILKDGDGQPKTWEKNRAHIDIRRVMVGGRGQRAGVMRARARIDLPWTLSCSFGYYSDLAPSLDVLKEIINRAGQSMGLLDWRPQTDGQHKGGWFGRYSLLDVELDLEQDKD